MGSIFTQNGLTVYFKYKMFVQLEANNIYHFQLFIGLLYKPIPF